MFQLYSKLAEYLQSGYAQERNTPFQKEKTNHTLLPKPSPFLEKKKKVRKKERLRIPWKNTYNSKYSVNKMNFSTLQHKTHH